MLRLDGPALRGASAAILLSLAACASQVTRPPEPADAVREPVRALSSFKVVMSP